MKNTLTGARPRPPGADALLAMLEGPTAIAFIEADGDMVAVAKALADSARTTKILAIRGGILDGPPIGEEEVKNLAKLPPLDVLRGQVLGAITAPLTTVVGLISAPVRDLIGLIDARIEQLQEQGDTSGGRGAEAQAAEEPVAEQRPPRGRSPAEETEPTEEPVAARADAKAVRADEDEPATPRGATEQPKRRSRNGRNTVDTLFESSGR